MVETRAGAKQLLSPATAWHDEGSSGKHSKKGRIDELRLDRIGDFTIQTFRCRPLRSTDGFATDLEPLG